MSCDNPIIDVIIPAYNASHYIGQAIDSVLSQTLSPARIIVVDDGSQDDTSAVVRSYSHARIPVQYVAEQNRGVSAARNKGISQSKAPYLAFLDADDLWYKDKLEKQWYVFFHSSYSRLGVVYTDYCFISHSGMVAPRNEKRFHLNPTIRGDIAAALLYENKIAGSASGVLIKRECFDTVGMFDESLKCFEDIDMWIRIAKHYQYDFCAEQLVGIRRHKGNISEKLSFLLASRIQFYEKWQNDPEVTGQMRSYWHTLLLHHISLIVRQLHSPFQTADAAAGYCRLIGAHPGDFFSGAGKLCKESFQVRYGSKKTALD